MNSLFHVTLVRLLALCGIFWLAQSSSQAQTIPVDRSEPGVTIYGKPDPFFACRTATSMDLSPDGKKMVVADRAAIRLFDRKEKKISATVKKRGYTSVHYSPNGDRVYAVKAVQPTYVVVDGQTVARESEETKTTLTIFDAESLEKIDAFQFDGPHRTQFAMGVTGRLLALGDNSSILVIDAITGEVERKIAVSAYSNMSRIAFIRDDQVLVFCDAMRVNAIDLTTGTLLKKADLKLIGENSLGLVGSQDGRWLITYRNNHLSRFDVLKNRIDKSVVAKGYPQRVFCSSEANVVAVSTYLQESADWGMSIYEFPSGKEIDASISGFYAVAAVVADDGEALYAVSNKNGIKYFPFSGSAERINFENPVGSVKPIQGRERMLAIHGGYSVRVLDLDELKLGEEQAGLQVPKAVFVDSDWYFFCCQRDQKVTLAFRPIKNGGREKRSTLGTNGPVSQGPFDLLDDYFDGQENVSLHRQCLHLDLCMADDGKHFYNMFDLFDMKLGGNHVQREITDRKVTIQKRTPDGKVVESWQIESDKLNKAGAVYYWARAAVSPDGKFAVIGNHVFDVAENRWIADLEGQGQNQLETEFSPDSKWMVVREINKVTVFETENFEVVKEYQSSERIHFSFSEDGKRLVVVEGGKSGFVKLVSCGDWEVLFERSETKGSRSSVSLLDGGNSIYFGLNDYRIEVWNWKAME